MNFDHYFAIGRAHQRTGLPCQDYAHGVSGRDGNSVFVGLSDGCSCAGGPKGETDIGARLLVRAFETEFLAQQGDVIAAVVRGELQKAALDRLAAFRGMIADDDMLATFVGIVAGADTVAVIVMGDGAIAIKERSGRSRYIRIEWRNSMPYYPAYAMQDKLWTFLEAHEQNDVDATPVTIEYLTVEPGREPESAIEKERGASQIGGGRIFLFSRAEIESLAVFSDGIFSFVKEGRTLPLSELVPRFVNFKGTVGRFVARRAMAALSREIDCPHDDDFSMAAIHFGLSPEEPAC